MGLTWKQAINDFSNYLKIEKSLSSNSVSAYTHDVRKLETFCEEEKNGLLPLDVTHKDMEDFIVWYGENNDNARTQARMLSGIKGFYRFLVIEGETDKNPTLLIESPKIGFKLPQVLSLEEILALMNAIDLSKPEGHRNKAIIEVLYGCGLRVSELINLQLTDIHEEEGFVIVTGKGDKQRLVPIGHQALKALSLYYVTRNQLKTIHDKNIVFLNRYGRKMTRAMIFEIIKRLAKEINLEKPISPHTFRHSFATHLIEGGADLRAVQEMLGHESITTTEIYTHIDRTFLRDTLIMFHPRG